jgi:hypothetical protein
MKFPVKKKSWLLIVVAFLLLLTPFIMHWIWLLKAAKPLDIILIDKTVSDLEKNEHASFTWLLNNLKIVKSSTKELYALDDYYGFFPLKGEKFKLADFEHLDKTRLEKLANVQVIYITDTYGVYSNEWYKHEKVSERSNLIYGGLTEKEIMLLRHLKEQKKLIIAEFNCIGSPTTSNIRRDFEELFRVKWTGWVGRYFENLSQTNTDIPRWLINNYKQQHKNNWAFEKSGIAFVNETDQIEILQEGSDLITAMPLIYSHEANANEFNIPKKIPYPYWFDIMQTDDVNIPVSLYHINTTSRGDSIMSKNGISTTFPAVLRHSGDDYQFYYFAGDFADNHISKKLSNYSGIAFMKSVLSSFHEDNREDFYWNYYYPLMSKILMDYQAPN